MQNLDLFDARIVMKKIYYDLVDETSDQRPEIENLSADIVILDNVLEHIVHFNNIRY